MSGAGRPPPRTVGSTCSPGGYYGTAEQAAAAIVRTFEQPETLPAPLAALYIDSGVILPCHAWSWRNRLLVALAGHADARGFRRWQAAGRWVKKGEKSVAILAPVVRTARDAAAGHEREVLVGFRGVAVFGLAQTVGAPLPAAEPATVRWLDALPLIDVARGWGCRSRCSTGGPARRGGCTGRAGGSGWG